MNSNCTWCQFLQSLYDRDLEAELTRYIRNLPEEIRVLDDVYTDRLAKCSVCPDCCEGICRHCGCYVAARAAKKPLGCPKPGNPIW